MTAVWAEVPLVHDEGTTACVIDPDTGVVIDETGCWEAAQNYVLHEGMVAIAVGDESDFWTRERQQALFDAERARYIDCWAG